MANTIYDDTLVLKLIKTIEEQKNNHVEFVTSQVLSPEEYARHVGNIQALEVALVEIEEFFKALFPST